MVLRHISTCWRILVVSGISLVLLTCLFVLSVIPNVRRGRLKYVADYRRVRHRTAFDIPSNWDPDLNATPDNNYSRGEEVWTDNFRRKDINSTLLLNLYKNSSREIQEEVGIAQVKKNANFTFMSHKKYVDILKLPKIEFLPGYKNPCWVEAFKKDPYVNAAKTTSQRRYYQSMTEYYNHRYLQNIRFRLRCLPYYYILGQPKCGTTDLYLKLNLHPDFEKGIVKEPHWWTRQRYGRNGWTQSLAEYVNVFDRASVEIQRSSKIDNTTLQIVRNKITGDASASTLWDNAHWDSYHGNAGREDPFYLTPQFLHHLQPDAKFIVSLRNPTLRLYSDYLFFSSAEKSAKDFHAKVVKAIDAFKTCTKHFPERACVYNSTFATYDDGGEMTYYTESVSGRVRLRIGLYVVFIRDWLAVFKKKQFMIIKLEERSENDKGVIEKILDFLEMRQLTPLEEQVLAVQAHANTRRKEDVEMGPMFESTAKLLDDFYKPYNDQLIELLDDARFNWTTHI
ncbi:unnamed protein product [Owenia fusiformis]|uniref:Sulfotransferase domain-containing protein n=1 Tax=Owenia fusiformis TaxID=6347 RepID=A0A8J1T5B2_OWEFU|nr:unnamed protein product [Owenia fusiformis]